MLINNLPTMTYISFRGLYIVDEEGQLFSVNDSSTCETFVYWYRTSPYNLVTSNDRLSNTTDRFLLFINNKGEGIEVPQDVIQVQWRDVSSGGTIIANKALALYDVLERKFITVETDVNGIKQVIGDIDDENGGLIERFNKLEQTAEGNKNTISKIEKQYNDDKEMDALKDNFADTLIGINMELAKYEKDVSEAYKDFIISQDEKDIIKSCQEIITLEINRLDSYHTILTSKLLLNNNNSEAVTKLNTAKNLMITSIDNLNNNINTVISKGTVNTNDVTTTLNFFATASSRVNIYKNTLDEVITLGIGGLIIDNNMRIEETSKEYKRSIEGIIWDIDGETGLKKQIANNKTNIDQTASDIKLNYMKFNQTTSEITVSDQLIKLDAKKVLMTGTLTWDSLDDVAKDNLKGKDGVNGTAEFIMMTGGQIFKYPTNSAIPTPMQIELTMTISNIETINTVVWQYKNSSMSSFTNISTSGKILTYTVAHNSVIWGNTDSVTVKCVINDKFSDEMTIVKLYDGKNGGIGQDGYYINLTNENHTFPCNSDGYIPNIITTTTEITAYKGTQTVEITNISYTTPSGLTITKNGTTLTIQTNVGNLLSNNGSFDINITIDGRVFAKKFTWSKAKQGNNGSNGLDAEYVIINGEQVFKYSNNFTSAPTPSSITLNVTKFNTTAIGKWQYKNASNSWVDFGITNNSISISPTSGVLGSQNFMCVRYIIGTNIYDEITIVKVTDGEKGDKGTSGDDAYTVYLTNENHTFPCENNGNIKVAISTSTNVMVLKGATPIMPTITNIPSANGLTIIKGSTSASNGAILNITANTGTALASNGSFNITISADGKTFTKLFSWSKAFKGANGEVDNLPDWINEWSSGVTEINGSKIVTPKIFAGSVDSGKPTGVAMGKDVFGNSGLYANTNGIVGYSNGIKTYEFDTSGGMLIGNKNNYYMSFDGSNLEMNIKSLKIGASSVATEESVNNKVQDIQKVVDITIKTVEVMYYLSNYNTSLSGGSWSTSAPTWVNGKYMWSKTVTTLSNGQTRESNPVCIAGAQGSNGSQGANGQGISNITEQYYLSDSKTSQSGGSWSTSAPTWVNGKYMWSRSKIDWTNPTSTTYTTPICDTTWEAVNGIEIGGTNLQPNSEWKNDTEGWVKDSSFSLDDSIQFEDSNSIKFSRTGLTSNTSAFLYSPKTILATSDITYTASAYFYTTNVNSIDDRVDIGIGYYTKEGSLIGNSIYTDAKPLMENGQWIRVTVTSTAPANTYYVAVVFRTLRNGNYWMSKPKLEKGNKATDWSPCPKDSENIISDLERDLMQQIDDNKVELEMDGELGFRLKVKDQFVDIPDGNALNGRIEEVESAFEKLNGSDETGFRFVFDKMIKEYTEGTNADISQIKEYIDFTSNGDINLHSTGSAFSLNIAKDKISFKDNGTEVAYMSTQKLYITDAQILNSLQIGKFKWIPRDNNNVSFTYVG